MLTYFLLSLCHVLMQLGGAYLRYLPFRQYMEQGETRRLWQRLALWSASSLILCAIIFERSALHVGVYKLVVFFSPIPYFLLSLTVIRQPMVIHLFVLGMQLLWVFALHTAAAIVENFLPADFIALHLLFVHPALYMAFFILALPLSIQLFETLLPTTHLFTDQDAKGRFAVSLLPFAIFVGFSLPIADSELLHSYQVQLSRISIPVFFFLMYRGLNLATKENEALRQARHTARVMEDQLAALNDYEKMLGESQRETAALVGKIREDYGQISDRLAAGDAEGAIQLIRDREDRLSATKVQAYSPYPILNAALSVYIGRAEALGIPVQCSVSLPTKLMVSENDLSVVVSNLLENAIEATMQEPEEARALSIGIRHRAKAVVLEIINPSTKRLVLDEDGLPVTSQKGHGLGMASLAAFMEKYKAYSDFTQENGQVRFGLYWEGDT